MLSKGPLTPHPLPQMGGEQDQIIIINNSLLSRFPSISWRVEERGDKLPKPLLAVPSHLGEG